MNNAIRITLAAAFSLPLAAQTLSINKGGVINAAAVTSAIAPGSLVSVYGSFGGVAAASAAATPLPTSLNGLSFAMGEGLAPLYFVSSKQANIQVPWDLTGGPTRGP